MSTPGARGPYQSYQILGQSRLSTPPKSAARSALTPSPQDPRAFTPSPSIRFGNGVTRRRVSPHLAAIQAAQASEPGPVVPTPPPRAPTPARATQSARRAVQFTNRSNVRFFSKNAEPPTARRSNRSASRATLRRRPGNLNSAAPTSRPALLAQLRATFRSQHNSLRNIANAIGRNTSHGLTNSEKTSMILNSATIQSREHHNAMKAVAGLRDLTDSKKVQLVRAIANLPEISNKRMIDLILDTDMSDYSKEHLIKRLGL